MRVTVGRAVTAGVAVTFAATWWAWGPIPVLLATVAATFTAATVIATSAYGRLVAQWAQATAPALAASHPGLLWVSAGVLADWVDGRAWLGVLARWPDTLVFVTRDGVGVWSCPLADAQLTARPGRRGVMVDVVHAGRAVATIRLPRVHDVDDVRSRLLPGGDGGLDATDGLVEAAHD